VLFVATDTFRPSPDNAAHAFCHALPGRWHQMSVMLTASSALDWAASLLGFEDLRSAVAAAEDRGLQADTPLFLPYLHGERTPHNGKRVGVAPCRARIFTGGA
jgi:xylulokinase